MYFLGAYIFLLVRCDLLAKPLKRDAINETNGLNATLKLAGTQKEDKPTFPLYTRLVPAMVTIGIFLCGVLVIYINYWMKQHRDDTNSYREGLLKDDWLNHLREQQTKDFSFGRKGSSISTFLSGEKSKLKKYALYDDMLAKYKLSLKKKKLQSMRRAAINLSTESSEDGGTLKRINNKARMKELAMRHKLSQEQGQDFSSRQRYLPRWKRTSNSQDDIEMSSVNIFRYTETDNDGSTTKTVQNRPISMFAFMNQSNADDIRVSNNAEMKRRSRCQENDEKIERQITQAIVSRLSSDVLMFLDQEVNDIKTGSEKELVANTCDHDKTKKPRTRSKSCYSNLKGSTLVDENVNHDNKVKRPTSLHGRLKKSAGGEYTPSKVDREEGDAINELFAKLIDISVPDMETDGRPRSVYDNDDFPMTSRPQSIITQNVDDANTPERSKNGKLKRNKDVDKMLKNVEQKMMKHLFTRDDLDNNEVAALENLLENVSRFCTEYSEEYGGAKRQISFAEANEELSEVAKSSRSSSPLKRSEKNNVKTPFDERRDKVMSVYDTDLLDGEPVSLSKFTAL